MERGIRMIRDGLLLIQGSHTLNPGPQNNKQEGPDAHCESEAAEECDRSDTVRSRRRRPWHKLDIKASIARTDYLRV